MLTAERGGWTVTFEYDGANRVTRTTQAGREIDYVYDVPGRTRSIAYPGGRTLTEQRDYRSRLQRIAEAGISEPIATYSYDLGDRVSERVYRNGSVASYSYNANDWIVEVAHASGGAPIADFSHEHDREGNKKFAANLFDSHRSEAYQYDRIYRLVDFRVGELQWTEEFKDEPVKIGDGVPPPKEPPRPPVGTK
jgi:YD repeat-containing protein